MAHIWSKTLFRPPAHAGVVDLSETSPEEQQALDDGEALEALLAK